MKIFFHCSSKPRHLLTRYVIPREMQAELRKQRVSRSDPFYNGKGKGRHIDTGGEHRGRHRPRPHSTIKRREEVDTGRQTSLASEGEEKARKVGEDKESVMRSRRDDISAISSLPPPSLAFTAQP